MRPWVVPPSAGPMLAPGSCATSCARMSASRWSSQKAWTLFVVATLAWWLARYLQVDLLGWGVGNDIHAYHHYAQQWGRGGAPYVSFHPEYPPGSLLVFLAPFLVGGSEDYG